MRVSPSALQKRRKQALDYMEPQRMLLAREEV